MSDTVDNLIGIVVLYNNKIEESKTLTSINKSLLKKSDFLDIIVYDNSENSEIKSGSTFSKGQLIIHYFHDPTNPGVSKAYNFSAKYAENLKKKWLLLLDQDTTFPVDILEKYMLAIKQNSEIKLFAPILKLSSGKTISPCRYFFKRGFALKKVTIGINSLQHISPLNSGMLINLNAFSLSGGYNELVKLDFSDFQFIERFKKNYKKCYIINAVCIHDFSDNDTDIVKLNKRYAIYCADAKNCEQLSFFDRFKFFIIVFIRANTLFFRTKNPVFYKTLINYLR